MPVLLYHHVSRAASGRNKYVLTQDRFNEQLDVVQSRRHPVMRLSEVWSNASADGERPPVVLTFDDGYASDYQVAFPVLQERGLSGEFFLNPATMGQAGYLSWAEAAEMRRAGMSFQSHAYDHVDLCRLPRRLLERQLSASKREIEGRLGCTVNFLAAPFGILNARVVEAALGAGYRAVCTGWNWPARPGGRTVSRITIYAYTTREEFSKLLAGDPMAYLARAARTSVLYVPTRIFRRFKRDDATLSGLPEEQ